MQHDSMGSRTGSTPSSTAPSTTSSWTKKFNGNTCKSKSGTRLFMFEFGRHNVNGIHFEGVRRTFSSECCHGRAGGLDYLGTATYQANLSFEALAHMPRLCGRRDITDRMAPLRDQLGVIAPLLEDHLIHMPFWAVAATRLD
jgi:hypothetical protein